MFSSASYGGGTVLFSDSSTLFLGADSDDPKKWMGNFYHNAMSAMDCNVKGEAYWSVRVYLSTYPHLLYCIYSPTHSSIYLSLYLSIDKTLRWCVLSSGEQQKCSDMAIAFKSKGLTPDIMCVYGDSVTDCMKKIQVPDRCFSPLVSQDQQQQTTERFKCQ